MLIICVEVHVNRPPLRLTTWEAKKLMPLVFLSEPNTELVSKTTQKSNLLGKNPKAEPFVVKQRLAASIEENKDMSCWLSVMGTQFRSSEEKCGCGRLLDATTNRFYAQRCFLVHKSSLISGTKNEFKTATEEIGRQGPASGLKKLEKGKKAQHHHEANKKRTNEKTAVLIGNAKKSFPENVHTSGRRLPPGSSPSSSRACPAAESWRRSFFSRVACRNPSPGSSSCSRPACVHTGVHNVVPRI